MKKLIFVPSVAICVLTGSVSYASKELNALTRCHEALTDKSEGRSEKLSTTTATPIMISSGKNIFFYTEKSVHVVQNKFSDKDVVFKLEEGESSLYHKINFKKNGTLGSISYQDLTKDEKQGAVPARTQLDTDSLDILKKDLIKRMNSVNGEYQNKYDPQATIDAINQCADIKSPELQTSLDKQVGYYRAMTKKASKYHKPKSPATN